MKVVSLFACGGIGDLSLRKAGFEVIVANELIEERAEVFKFNYPKSNVIIGDIWEKKQEIIATIKSLLSGDRLDFVFATPPCQGMSKNGRGKLLNLIRKGVKSEVDFRNLLIIPTIEIFLASGAHTLVIENVPEMENTFIPSPNKSGQIISIIDFIKESIGSEFVSSINVVEFADFGVPQNRQRLICIFTKNLELKRHMSRFGTLFPNKTHSKNGNHLPKWKSVRDAISHLPPLDAAKPETAKHNDIPFHYVPLLDSEKYFWVSNTPPEKGAFDNQCVNPSCKFDKNPTHSCGKNAEGVNKASTTTPIYCIKCGHVLPRPWVKDGDVFRLMKGYTSAYKRMSGDAPASTLTRNLSYACSDNKLHPSQNRVLSLYEAMILHTVTEYEFYWQRSSGKRVSDKLVREIIGESIPPIGLESIFSHLSSILSGQEIFQKTSSLTQKQLCLF